jgi:hypothetical protein
MLTTGEQRELRQIEEVLRDTDRGFVWRLTLVQGVLRWAAPGRQGCLLILAALAAALGRLAAAAGRLLKELARGGGAHGSDHPDDSRRHGLAGLESEQPPGHSVSQAQDRPQSDWTDLP